MKVYAITYYVEDGEAGISALYKDKKKADKHFSACVRGTFEGSDADEATIRAAVKLALKKGVHDYSGSGCGHDNPWYALSAEEVQ